MSRMSERSRWYSVTVSGMPMPREWSGFRSSNRALDRSRALLCRAQLCGERVLRCRRRSGLLVVDHDAAAAERGCPVSGLVAVVCHLVVVDDGAGDKVCNLDAEGIGLLTATAVAIHGGHHEVVLALPVDRPSALELRLAGTLH